MTDHFAPAADEQSQPYKTLPPQMGSSPNLRSLLRHLCCTPVDLGSDHMVSSFMRSGELQDRSAEDAPTKWQRWDLSLNSVVNFNSSSRQHGWVAALMNSGRRVSELQQELRSLAKQLVEYIPDIQVRAATSVYFSILGVADGAISQQRHRDNCRISDYYTAMFPLTNYPHQGGTMFDGGLVPPENTPYYFSGSTYHWGTANASGHTRYVLMAILKPSGEADDQNRRGSDEPVSVPKVVQKRSRQLPARFRTQS